MENKKLNISKLYGIPGEAIFESFIHSDTQENHKYVQNLPCMFIIRPSSAEVAMGFSHRTCLP